MEDSNRILGRTAIGSGSTQELKIGTGLRIQNDTIDATGLPLLYLDSPPVNQVEAGVLIYGSVSYETGTGVNTAMTDPVKLLFAGVYDGLHTYSTTGNYIELFEEYDQILGFVQLWGRAGGDWTIFARGDLSRSIFNAEADSSSPADVDTWSPLNDETGADSISVEEVSAVDGTEGIIGQEATFDGKFWKCVNDSPFTWEPIGVSVPPVLQLIYPPKNEGDTSDIGVSTFGFTPTIPTRIIDTGLLSGSKKVYSSDGTGDGSNTASGFWIKIFYEETKWKFFIYSNQTIAARYESDTTSVETPDLAGDLTQVYLLGGIFTATQSTIEVTNAPASEGTPGELTQKAIWNSRIWECTSVDPIIWVEQGVAGKDGTSAYQAAIEAGVITSDVTEEEWAARFPQLDADGYLPVAGVVARSLTDAQALTDVPKFNEVVILANGRLVVGDGNTTAENLLAGVMTVIESDATAYTLVAGDSGKCREFTAASTITVTLPNQANEAFRDGTYIVFDQGGAGAIRIAEASGVSVFPSDKRQSIGQFSTFAILRIGINNWRIIGDLDP
ncbi:hypothetical protein JIN85_14640 [Luteolibacter pohnpeiensis]|uniref:Uncharacterized protein n=1 Tax=Luteolibacter pohnpeiensis TaxID=454153 RepID=A0A934VRX2_9BACT|nr:hypothetical protein [Luteolibacter pohnpeiensis]MBK1883656.1 hypothetical protein [Luteolibacter pohnpeiensis]